MATIVFNGKTYNSIEEMPPEARQAYEQVANLLVDRNGNGIPDFLEGDMVKNIMSAFTSSVDFNGHTYSNMNDLPPEAREKVQAAFQKLSDMGIVSGQQNHFMQTDHSHLAGTPMPVSKPFVSREYNPAIQEDKGPGLMVWLMIGLGFALCVATAAVGAFLVMRS
jgi:hypothetical protein